MTSTTGREPHASLDIRSRQEKARKIEALLSIVLRLEGAWVLEVGTGAGIIANHLSQCVGPEGKVIAVDVLDQRQILDGFRYVPVSDTGLPFQDASFDVVISNHVMEHVGDRNAQLHHLQEIRRVLKENGWGYLAVPNRWRLIEPHFRLPLLSWLPQRLRSSYVRLTGRGEVYDCNPPGHFELISLFREAGLSYVQQSFEGMRMMADVESVSFPSRFVLNLPKLFLRQLYPIIPTMIFLLRRGQDVSYSNPK